MKPHVLLIWKKGKGGDGSFGYVCFPHNYTASASAEKERGASSSAFPGYRNPVQNQKGKKKKKALAAGCHRLRFGGKPSAPTRSASRPGLALQQRLHDKRSRLSSLSPFASSSSPIGEEKKKKKKESGGEGA